MQFKNRKLLILTFFFLTTVTASVFAQRPDFNRPSTYDVQHYIIRVSFDRPAKKVIGETTIRFKPLAANFRTADFDAVDIKFTDVTLEPAGTPVKYRVQSGKISVTLDRAYGPEDTITLRFKHTAVPKKGVYFVDEEIDKGKVIHSAQIWTQGEPDEARHWFPSFDFPSDKATVEEFINAYPSETVVGNGRLVEKTENSDGTVTHHFSLEVPASVYLYSFVIGQYAHVSEKYRDISLGFYVYPGSEAIVPKAYGLTKDMIRIYEDVTKIDYPYPKYDQTIVSGFTFGGMENITATTMADTEIYLANLEFTQAGVHDLVSHELAHSWFGNLVTCRNWAELWLNEGFATFMEAVVREKMYGRRNYMNKIRRDAETFITDDAVNNKRNGLFNLNAGNVAELFDRPATTYNKGGAVLHTLREEIGDEAFWKAVQIYLQRHKYGNAESSDLLAAMEETSGRDLNWFFDQWVYMAGHPKLAVTQVWNERTKTLRLTVRQTQKIDKITPAAFRLPMDIEFTTARGKKTEKIDITKRSEVFSFKLPAKPSHIEFDPAEKIPLKTVKMLAARAPARKTDEE